MTFSSSLLGHAFVNARMTNVLHSPAEEAASKTCRVIDWRSVERGSLCLEMTSSISEKTM
jgi:hypothetical protein